ncbi:MAG: Na(+)/H(+) antiporter subunit D [Pseudomonadota bacterium]
MINDLWIHPGLVIVIGALAIPLLRGVWRQVYTVALPVAAFWLVLTTGPGTYGAYQFLGQDIICGKVDKLSLIFAHVFTLMAIIGAIYSLHVKEWGHQMAGFFYVGGSLGVTFAGDYLTLFVFWELMAFASVFLVWYRKTQQSIDAGYRYLLVHVAGGLFLLGGMLLRLNEVGNLVVGPISTEGATLASYLIMIGFCLNAAVPPIHAWLPDAYPEATVAGAVFMCAFTTKTAVYALARVFPGHEILAILGAIMTVYGVGYAVIENNARRILAYHIVSQVGYMVCGVGIGTQMAINGTCAHAYAHIIYKALLFMGAGAVLEMTGRSKLSELGGLYKYMPLTMIWTVIGGISISGFPLTSGFVSKSMIVAAAHHEHAAFLTFMMMLAGVGTFLSVGLKLPYFIWFGKDSGVKAKEAPLNMHIAMAIAAFLCIYMGIDYGFLYKLLPYPNHWAPYSTGHLLEMTQVLVLCGLGFFIFLKRLTPEPHLNLDVDYFYRYGARGFMWVARTPLNAMNDLLGDAYKNVGFRWIFMGVARAASWFDWHIIDGILDGTANTVRRIGDMARRLQSGRLQYYVGFSALTLFFILGIDLLLK